MNNETHFTAPWSTTVKILTAFLVLLLLGITVVDWTIMPARMPQGARLLLAAAPLAVLLATLPFMVRGYSLHEHELVIQRLGWANHIDLRPLVSVKADPQAMAKSIRLFGCGGFCGFFGSFRNRSLGIYRAYCTDPSRSVVLKFANRTLVVTPEDPERFVSEIESLRAAA